MLTKSHFPAADVQLKVHNKQQGFVKEQIEA